MAANTSIEWADDTVNFWTGCTQVSPGCDHCYAKDLARRFNIVAWNGPPAERIERAVKELQARQRKAVKTGTRRYVFINSMSDTFDNRADDMWRRALFAAIHVRPDIVALVLTKRIGNVEQMMSTTVGWPSNAWLGITVVNQQEADRDIPKLLTAKSRLKIPRAFLSVEPMLGAIDITSIARTRAEGFMRPLDGRFTTLDWVICGGESGAKARPMHPDWARSLRDQCADAGVPFFFKQWGEWKEWKHDIDGPHVDVIDTDDKAEAAAVELARLPHAVGGLTRSGRFYPEMETWADSDEEEPIRVMERLGKARAGRLLDGVEHNGRPQP